MLGRPVVRRLVQEGFAVRVMARNPPAAAAVLPAGVECVAGDLERPDEIDAALQHCSAVYLSVDSKAGARFLPETEGLRNVLLAAKNHRPRLLLLSALGVARYGQDHPWWHMREKYAAQEITRKSDLAVTIFEPAWFMETLPVFVSGKTFLGLSGVRLESYWIAGDDYGRIVAAALKNGAGAGGEIVPVQGPELLGLNEAGRRFIAAYDPGLRLRQMPFAVLRALGLFSGQIRELGSLLKYYRTFYEPEPDPAIWGRLARPTMNIAEYAAYIRATGDFPRK